MADIPTESPIDEEEMVPLQPLQPLQPLISSVYLDNLQNVYAWYRDEFAAANAIIDVLCTHLQQLSASSNDFDSVFAAIKQRRRHWLFPILQSQMYYSIAGVTFELDRVAEKKTEFLEFSPGEGSKQMHQSFMSNNIFSNLEGCEERSSQIKLIRGFKAMESVKRHKKNVVKGLRLFEDAFSESEICKLNDFVNEIHDAGQRGELSGQTFVLFNKEMKGEKREFIQLGVPIFEQKNDDKSNLEPIPSLLHGIIDHLSQCKLILNPKHRRPNSCIISFFEEGEFSQPFLKPPHLENPVITLLLSESTMAFGHILTRENDGNYKGSLMLPLKKGSVLVMRRHSANIARHVMCPSPNRRVSINFFKVKTTRETWNVPSRQRRSQGQSTRKTWTAPSRLQKWLMELPSPSESQMEENAFESSNTVEG